MRRSCIILLAIISCLALTVNVTAVTFNWEGFDWTTVNTGTDVLITRGKLVVYDTTNPIGWVKTVESMDFFEVTANMDQGPQSVIMIADYASTDGAQFAINIPAGQIGIDDGDNGFGDFTWVSASMATSGTHTLSFQLDGSGYVDIKFDGSSVYTATGALNINTMEYIHLGAMNGTGVFTNAVPEPATIALLGLGALLLVRKRK